MTEGAVVFAQLQIEPLYDTLGEQAAAALVANATALLRDKVEAGGGRTVKTIGDEIFAFFSLVADAVAAAIVMQQRVSSLASTWPGGSNLGIGLSWGPVVDRDGDVFGDTVSIASRAASLSGARRIVLSGDAAAHLHPDQRATCRLVHTIDLKGRADKIEFFELPWE